MHLDKLRPRHPQTFTCCEYGSKVRCGAIGAKCMGENMVFSQSLARSSTLIRRVAMRDITRVKEKQGSGSESQKVEKRSKTPGDPNTQILCSLNWRYLT
jgi:hypothetical protein